MTRLSLFDLFALLLIPIATLSCEPIRDEFGIHQARVEIVNAANASVSGEVMVSGHDFKFDQLAIGKGTTFHYQVRSCGNKHYHVMASLGGGRKLDKTVGYIEAGHGLKARITIRSNDVEIEEFEPGAVPQSQ